MVFSFYYEDWVSLGFLSRFSGFNFKTHCKKEDERRVLNLKFLDFYIIFLTLYFSIFFLF
jgi:hypothetical protein